MECKCTYLNLFRKKRKKKIRFYKAVQTFLKHFFQVNLFLNIVYYVYID